MIKIGEISIKITGILIGGFFFLPFVALIYESLRWNSWAYVAGDEKTYEALFTTVQVAFFTLALNLVIGTPAAGILARKEFLGKIAVEGIIFLPLIIPSFVTSMGVYFTFIKIGIAETVTGVVLIHTVLTLPYYIHSAIIGYRTFDEGYEDMGKVMGASGFQRFFHITLPHIMPSIIAGGSLVIIVSFAQYLNTLIIGGGRVLTIPILMFPYISGGDIRVGAVYSIIYILINFLLLLILEKKVKNIYNKKMSGEKLW